MARVVPLRTAAKEESMGGGQGIPRGEREFPFPVIPKNGGL